MIQCQFNLSFVPAPAQQHGKKEYFANVEMKAYFLVILLMALEQQLTQHCCCFRQFWCNVEHACLSSTIDQSE